MNRKVLTLTMLSALLIAPALFAQENEAEIVIVNQDGDRVGAGQIDVQVDTDKTGSQFKIEGDTIIITDEKGETRKIDISGARSVSVQQSMKSVNKDGEQKTETHGKAIIIGPDGSKQVIELGAPLDGDGDGVRLKLFGDALPKGLFVGDEPLALRFLPNQNVWLNSEGKQSKFMIGVRCEPVSDQLRAHLELDEGVGLIVQSTFEDTPATNSGIRDHDILMFADDSALTSVADLSEVVERAGTEGKSFSLTAIRNGKEIHLDVQPAERPADQHQEGNLLFGRPDFDMQFRQLGPGVIVGNGDDVALPEDFQRQMDEFRDRIKNMELDMRNRMRQDMQNLQPGNDLKDDIDN